MLAPDHTFVDLICLSCIVGTPCDGSACSCALASAFASVFVAWPELILEWRSGPLKVCPHARIVPRCQRHCRSRGLSHAESTLGLQTVPAITQLKRTLRLLCCLQYQQLNPKGLIANSNAVCCSPCAEGQLHTGSKADCADLTRNCTEWYGMRSLGSRIGWCNYVCAVLLRHTCVCCSCYVYRTGVPTSLSLDLMTLTISLPGHEG